MVLVRPSLDPMLFADLVGGVAPGADADESTDEFDRRVAHWDQHRLALVHRNGERFLLRDESDGTRSWLFLLPDLLDCLENGSVLVVDEIDTSLHPLLVRKLVEIFQSRRHNPRGGQLVFTTHDAYLLAPVDGTAALERDQVWFVDKSAEGCSRLYPLSDFHPRNEHNLARRYLGGAYGAVPFLDELDDLALQQGDRSADSIEAKSPKSYG